MSTSSPEQKHRFVVLDGMRGVAAIMVMISHCSNFAPLSFLAVDMFFLLSGFVLAYGFGTPLSLPGGRLRFAIGRLVRLYPLYAIGSLLALSPAIGMVILKMYFFTPASLAVSLLAAPFFIPLPYDWTFPLDPPAWSLSFELIANAVFMFVAARLLPAVLLVLCSAPLLLWALHVWQDGGGSYWTTLPGGFPRVMFSFFLGVLMCRFWCSGRLPKFRLHPLLLAALLVGLYAVQPHHDRRYVVAMILVIQPVLIWIGASSTAEGWNARVMSWLGMISYGVYVLHLPILLCVEGIQRLTDPALMDAPDILPLSVYIVVPVSILAAHWLTLHFEIPLRRRLNARLNLWLMRKPVA